MDHAVFMEIAFNEAEKGYHEGGIPIGSVLVIAGQIVGKGHNRRIQQGNPILHGEMDALQAAGRLKASDYQRATLYTTLSPCSMCSGAILLYQIPQVVIGENETFMGEEQLLRERGVEVTLLKDDRCRKLLQQYIAENPAVWNEDIGESV